MRDLSSLCFCGQNHHIVRCFGIPNSGLLVELHCRKWLLCQTSNDEQQFVLTQSCLLTTLRFGAPLLDPCDWCSDQAASRSSHITGILVVEIKHSSSGSRVASCCASRRMASPTPFDPWRRRDPLGTWPRLFARLLANSRLCLHQPHPIIHIERGRLLMSTHNKESHLRPLPNDSFFPRFKAMPFTVAMAWPRSGQSRYE